MTAHPMQQKGGARLRARTMDLADHRPQRALASSRSQVMVMCAGGMYYRRAGLGQKHIFCSPLSLPTPFPNPLLFMILSPLLCATVPF
ncbi:hypothetical protein EJ03DRAFT_93916 [Teratosphaeria nubilosa]|uniref:Uncharacterized protein n=1 Tax=Teratosphaeria nubilosa TaxID=161662 RepID=A0A6G1L9F7_9PEZI|nr:hypothetical protein EJ03DRAFT_93916 [Teratosphaeria nubilosa]